jgi:hypothetical protein
MTCSRVACQNFESVDGGCRMIDKATGVPELNFSQIVSTRLPLAERQVDE